MNRHKETTDVEGALAAFDFDVAKIDPDIASRLAAPKNSSTAYGDRTRD